MSDASRSLSEALARVDALRAEIGAMRPLTDEQFGRAMQRLRLEWTYHSNAIEGNTYGYGETVALLMEGGTAHGKPLKDALDIQRHREVLGYLEDIVSRQERLTLRDIRGMHAMLMGETYSVAVERPDGTRSKREEQGGAFKQHANHVLTPTGEVQYYAKPEETPALMRDLLDWYEEAWPEIEAGNVAVLSFAADFHHRFVQIHPFPDGNGRLGRILMNLMLMQRGYVPAVLRQERRGLYCAALNRANTEEIEPLVSFIAEELAETMGLYLHAARGDADPVAFDRRLALLKREQENARIDRAPLDERAQLAKHLIRPLISRAGQRASKMEELFELNEYVFTVHDTDGALQFNDEAMAVLDKGAWSAFDVAWRFKRFRHDSVQRANPRRRAQAHGRTGGSPIHNSSRGEKVGELHRMVEPVFQSALDEIETAGRR